MKLKKIESYEEFRSFFSEYSAWAEECDAWIQNQDFHKKKLDRFTFDGYSHTARTNVSFLVERNQARSEYTISWRESVLCPVSRLNSRNRAAIHIFDVLFQPKRDEKIWLCEQVTPLYRFMLESFPFTVGSEYLGPEFQPGAIGLNSIRHESMTASSFGNASLDYVLSFDVMEHIPNYRTALSETLRVLKPGGNFIWTAPFVAGSKDNTALATIENGQTLYHSKPSYHGDPLTGKPILCFTYFGWEVLEEMKTLGFRTAYGLCYSSIHFGYIGTPNFILVGVK